MNKSLFKVQKKKVFNLFVINFLLLCNLSTPTLTFANENLTSLRKIYSDSYIIGNISAEHLYLVCKNGEPNESDKNMVKTIRKQINSFCDAYLIGTLDMMNELKLRCKNIQDSASLKKSLTQVPIGSSEKSMNATRFIIERKFKCVP